MGFCLACPLINSHAGLASILGCLRKVFKELVILGVCIIKLSLIAWKGYVIIIASEDRSIVSGCRYNSIDSFIFCKASSSVSPQEVHPGNSGHQTAKSPVSESF